MPPTAVASAIVVDCLDPARVASFWQGMLGGRTVRYPEAGVVALRAPGITFDFTRNADPKAVKNRWHLDVASSDPDAAIAVALTLGGARADDFDESDHVTVLRDPEGNEFCILRAATADTPWAPPPGAAP